MINAVNELKNCIAECDRLSDIMYDDLSVSDKIKLEYLILNNLEKVAYHWSQMIFEDEGSRVKCDEADITELNSLSYQAQSAYKKFCDEVDNLDFEFKKITNDKYRLILPPALSRHKNESKTYNLRSKYITQIAERLLYANQKNIVQMTEATIIFIYHCQNKGTIIRDNDNADSSNIINLINKYFLSTDDAGNRVSLFYDCVLDENTYTEVIIGPKIPTSFMKRVKFPPEK